MQALKDLCKPERTVYHIKAPVWLEQTGTFTDNVVKCTQYFMACDSFGRIGIDKSVVTEHIRRVGGYDIADRSAEDLRSPAQIALDDINRAADLIVLNGTLRHIDIFGLDLKSGKMLSFGLSVKQDRNNAVAGTEVDHRLTLFHPRKSGQQDRIHSETEPGRILYDLEVVPLKVIEALSRFY